MREENNHHGSQSDNSGDLLTELGSIKQLLDDELDRPAPLPVTSIEEIGSVKEYLQLKQAAEQAGLSIEAYLAQQHNDESTIELELLDGDEVDLPVLGEVISLDEEESSPESHDLLLEIAEEEERLPPVNKATSVEEYFAAVAAAKQRTRTPQPPSTPRQPLSKIVDDDDEIPLLDELADDDAAHSTAAMSMDEMQEMVDFIVNRKLQQLRPDIEKEVLAELKRLLSLSSPPHA
ncbi:MAG: hypothetical protein OEZ16_00385 [Chromatiales bacterium]|nr:hypothetical protein [Chromatiales bacterium]